MPSVPATSRTTSFIAEPTPALAFGSEPMIASVAGAIAMPMPAPIVASTSAMCPSVVCTSKPATITSAPATAARPDATGTFVPTLRVSITLVRAVSIIPAAIGSIRTPAESASWPSTDCR